MKKLLWCILILPMFMGDAFADDKFISVGAHAGFALPEKGKPYGGFVGYRDEVSSIGLAFSRLSTDGDGVNHFRVEGGYFLGKRWYARPHIALGFIWTGSKDYNLDWSGGLELGRSLKFVDLDGLLRAAVGVEYLPDEFDGKVGGHGGDVMITGRFYMDFEF